jgi:ribosomal protein S18 acetylase RimI-like enzyme
MATATYCKRLRMEIDLEWIDPVAPLPLGLVWAPWDDAILRTHSDVMWRSFRDEFDARVFPNFARRAGCIEMMRTICERPGFIPEATWLIAAPDRCCGTIQGLIDESGLGMIQNLGVLPRDRRMGLGRALLLKALHGFRGIGLKRAYLEVTARNSPAVRLYHQLGFVICKTSYRELDPIEDESYSI